MNVKMDVAIRPGSARGNTMWSTARPRPAPSTWAASSSETGIEPKKARRSHSANGRQNDEYESTSAVWVFTRDRRRARM
ncbi:MAG: hypothetical protein DME12_16280 [Candidatus Rokuibacteriota bacterium]|nr:MAG: hypothetical protein DME12_16280 [Candidatus Rokubacteria bacterium]